MSDEIIKANRIYLLSIIPKPGVSFDEIERRLYTANGWYRFHRGQYAVSGEADAKEWREALKNLVEPEGQILVCRLDMTDRAGWINKKFWTWVKRNTESGQQFVLDDIGEPGE